MAELTETDIIDKLFNKNEKFYNLFGRLHENEKYLVKKDYKEEIAKIIFTFYKSEIKKIMLEYDAEQAPEFYRLEYMAEEKRPRKSFFLRRKNRAMKALDKQLEELLEKYFNELAGNQNASEQPPAETMSETTTAQSDVEELPEESLSEDPQSKTSEELQELPEGIETPSEQSPVDTASETTTAQTNIEESTAEPLNEDPQTGTSEDLQKRSEDAEAPPEQLPATPKKKHKRGNKTPAVSAQATSKAQPAEQLPLEEVPTDGGAQIRLSIP